MRTFSGRFKFRFWAEKNTTSHSYLHRHLRKQKTKISSRRVHVRTSYHRLARRRSPKNWENRRIANKKTDKTTKKTRLLSWFVISSSSNSIPGNRILLRTRYGVRVVCVLRVGCCAAATCPASTEGGSFSCCCCCVGLVIN